MVRNMAQATDRHTAPDPAATARGRAASIADRARFDLVRYSNVWEDADVLCEALAPAAAGGRLLSIASAGDNALALLTLDPAEVVAIDLSAAQIACLEARVAAFRRLDDADLLGFLGVTECGRRAALWSDLRRDVSAPSAGFWDARPAEIGGGIIHAGRFERYLRLFVTRALPFVHGRATREALIEPRDEQARAEFYERRWNTWRWRLMFRLFFSRLVMGRLGRDPAFFDQVEGAVGPRILARTRHALTALPTHDNPYLVYIMTGNFAPHALPRYLRPEHRGAIRARLDRLRVVRGAAQEAPGRFQGMNLSDIFEYMPAAEFERVYRALVDRAEPGARIAYWNMLAPRECPAGERARVRPLSVLSASLLSRDRAWFYRAFHVDEVVAGGAA